ncbi:MAG: hypothetical protein PWQ37_1098 [Candidatus Petromonas sp.]|jgi:hypothetical protein|nr:hypothetical protein [Candidatus Petromonas sp.]
MDSRVYKNVTEEEYEFLFGDKKSKEGYKRGFLENKAEIFILIILVLVLNILLFKFNLLSTI